MDGKPEKRGARTISAALDRRAIVFNSFLVLFVYAAFLIWPPAAQPVLNPFILLGFAYLVFGTSLLYKKSHVRKGSFFLFAGLFLIMVEILKF